MVDVRGDVLRPPHGTTPAAVKSNINPKNLYHRALPVHRSVHENEYVHNAAINYRTAQLVEHTAETNQLTFITCIRHRLFESR